VNSTIVNIGPIFCKEEISTINKIDSCMLVQAKFFYGGISVSALLHVGFILGIVLSERQRNQNCFTVIFSCGGRRVVIKINTFLFRHTVPQWS
jgi:hypothetical protein